MVKTKHQKVPLETVKGHGFEDVYSLHASKTMSEDTLSEWRDEPRDVSDLTDGTIHGDWIRQSTPELPRTPGISSTARPARILLRIVAGSTAF